MNPKAQFQTTITRLMAARDTLNATLNSGRAAKQAREFAIQGYYLVAVRAFEAFLEDQIHALATNRVRWASRKLNGNDRVRWANRLLENRPDFVKELMLRGQEYADYLPYERSVKIAHVLFTGGRPFSLLAGNDKVTLRRCQRVRNFIAHRSDFAQKKFIAEYEALKPLRVPNPTPIHYLDDQIRSGTTLFEHDLAQLAAISNFLS